MRHFITDAMSHRCDTTSSLYTGMEGARSNAGRSYVFDDAETWEIAQPTNTLHRIYTGNVVSHRCDISQKTCRIVNSRKLIRVFERTTYVEQ